MKLSRLSAGEAIAAVSAIALFAFTFLGWYGYAQGGNLLVAVNLFGFPADAWQSLDLIPLLLLPAILAALGTAALRVGGWRSEPVVEPSAIVAVLGGLATLLILFRIVFPPDLLGGTSARGIPLSMTVELGAYLALAAALGVAYGGYRAMGERGSSFAAIADSLANERPRAGGQPRKGQSRPRERPASRRRSPSSSD